MHAFLDVLWNYGRIAIIPLLVLVNAFFVAAEFSLVTVRRTRLEEMVAKKVLGSGAAEAAVRRLDDMIAAIQLGITMTSLALGWVGEPALAHIIEPWFSFVPPQWGIFAAHGIATALAFLAITYLHVVVGELAPRALALDRPGPVALTCARPLLVFGRVFRPVLWLMNGTGNLLARALGVRRAGSTPDVHSAEEISMLVAESRAAGAIRPYAGQILGNVFRLSRTRMRDVMVPRERVVAIGRSIRTDALLDLIKESGFTRIPVYDDAFDNVIGILHTKDLFQVYADRRVVILEDAIRPAVFFPSDLSIVNALRRFRRGRQHLAIVRDEGGPVIGVCTLEDVLEEIVGDIEDEHD